MRQKCLGSVVAVLLISGCGDPTPKSANELETSPDATLSLSPSSENVSSSAQPEVADNSTVGSILTPPQMNAVRSAEQYLSMQGFSRDGLIEQLSSSAGDGYSEADATAAVDSLSVDWNENAAKSARQYLSMQGFSCSGLIEQLSSRAGDKYTVEQATYGARQAGAC